MTGVVTAGAAGTARWLRYYPAITPDGQEIALSYRGNLRKVPARGGQATQLTVHAACGFMPAWSADGSKIAFASDRYARSDVFVMPAGSTPAPWSTTTPRSQQPEKTNSRKWPWRS